MKRLEGKVAVVTGGSTGIGGAICKLFAREGATVSFCARGQERGEQLAAEIRGEGGVADFTSVDVSSEGEVTRWIDGVATRHGRIDIVVNNAGILYVGMIETMPLEKWDEILRINITGMFLVSRSVVPHLRRAGGGVIINLGSTFGMVGASENVAYGMTKAAAINFSKGLALELVKDGIRVNALCPAGTDTEMSEWSIAVSDDPRTARADAYAKHPMGRFSTVEEQAAAALFLASDDASYVTGHAMLVDGGYTAQ